MLDILVYKRKLAKVIDELSKIFENSEYRENFIDFKYKYDEVAEREKACVVIAGEYSTGKSTIVSALTDNQMVEIDSDVKTNLCTMYEYEGLNIIDTPGLLSGFDEHTQITKAEIDKADFIVYCITTELFTPSSLKEFIAILDNNNFNHKVILVVNKFGMEACGCSERLDLMERYLDEIAQTIHEAGKIFDENLIRFISAKKYIDGKNCKDDAMIEDSYFIDFMDLLNGNTKGIKGLNFRCEKQVAMILDFLQKIKLDMNRNNSSEERRKKALKIEEIKKKISDREETEKKIINREFFDKEGELLKYVRDVYDDDQVDTSEMNKHINTELNFFIEEKYRYIKRVCEEIDEGINNKEIQESKLFQINENIVIERDEKKKRKKIDIKMNSGVIQQGASEISRLAEPVEIGKKGFFRRKKILSEIGGEGTKLNSMLSKVFGKNSTKVSSRVGKIASSMDKNPQIIKGGAIAFEVALSARKLYIENRQIEKRNKNINKLERSIKEVFEKQKKNVVNEFSDDIMKILEKINSSSGLFADNEFERKIEEKIIELQNLKKKVEKEEDNGCRIDGAEY